MTRLQTLSAAKKALGEGKLADGGIYKADFAGIRLSAEMSEKMKDVVGYRPKIDVDLLKSEKEGTFAHSFYLFMTANALSPFELSDDFPEDVLERNVFGYRYAVTHDMFHVLLGYDTSWSGEMGVLAFASAQGYTKAQLYIAFPLAIVVYCILAPLNIGRTMRNLREGWRMGKEAKCLLGARLEDMMAQPIDEVRRQMNIISPANENDGLILPAPASA